MELMDFEWTIGSRISRFLSRRDEWPVVEAVRGVSPDAGIANHWTIEKHWLCAYCNERNTSSWIVKISTDIHCGHCHEVNSVVLKGGER